jgi:hypothetical protein
MWETDKFPIFQNHTSQTAQMVGILLFNLSIKAQLWIYRVVYNSHGSWPSSMLTQGIFVLHFFYYFAIIYMLWLQTNHKPNCLLFHHHHHHLLQTLDTFITRHCNFRVQYSHFRVQIWDRITRVRAQPVWAVVFKSFSLLFVM